jgi:hypothetical protein
MPIDIPAPDSDRVLDALRAAAARGTLPTRMGTAELRELAAELRARSVFTARGSNAIFVSKIKTLIDQLASGQIDPGEVRRVLRATLNELGYTPEGGFGPEDLGRVPPAVEGSLQDLRSNSRLNLIVGTQRDLMAGAGQQARGTTPERLSAFPAWQLVRIVPRRVPRNWTARWQQAGGTLRDGRMVALKGDPVWGELGSSANFDDALDVDTPPFAYNSGMGWREVNAEEAQRLGVVPTTGEPTEDFQQGRPRVIGRELPKPELSMDGVDPDVLRAFLADTDALPAADGGPGYSLNQTLARSIARAQESYERRAG